MLSELYFMKKTFKNIFFLLIIFIQLSSTESNPNKCYSILNCEKCPELDFCEKCLDGFIMNNPKTKCIGKETQKNENTKNNIQINENIKQINNNNINQKKSSLSSNQNQTKKSIDPFQNIPFKSIQQAKKSDLNRARINRLLIIIIIILAISIIISAAYDFIKKMMNNNHEEYDTQEESTKVVIR